MFFTLIHLQLKHLFLNKRSALKVFVPNYTSVGKALVLCMVLLMSELMHAQSIESIGPLLQWNVNGKVSSNVTLNSKIESRSFFTSEVFVYERTDLDAFLTKRTGFDSEWGGGVMLRREGTTFIIRFIQQYGFKSMWRDKPLGHRFRFDQTFEPDEVVAFRLRYRINRVLPFQGDRLDPGEWYLKGSFEVLGIHQSSVDLELRSVWGVGYLFQSRNIIELGNDTRMSEVIPQKYLIDTWVTVKYYYRF